MFFFLILFLIVSLFLESTVTTLPLVFICLLCWTIRRRDALIFPLAFFYGFFLDTLTLHPLGGASIFFLGSVFLILLYQRKYEIHTYPFVVIASFVGSLLFLVIFGSRDVLIQAAICSIIAILFFGLLGFLAGVKQTTAVIPAKAGIHFKK